MHACCAHPPKPPQWLRARGVAELHCDSRKVGAGDGFIAWPGAATDGRKFVPAALQQGAKACLVEHAGSEAYGFASEAVAAYEGLKAATGPIGALFYGEPTRRWTCWRSPAPTARRRPHGGSRRRSPTSRCPAAWSGRWASAVPPHVEHTGLTTPDPVLMQRHFRRFVQEGAKACAIEASSIGIVERRMDGTRIRVAAFTNFTQDHLDYHGSMEAYWAGQGGTVPLARAAGRGGEHRRRKGRELEARAAGRCA